MNLRKNLLRRIIIDLSYPKDKVLYLKKWKEKKGEFFDLAQERVEFYSQKYNFKYQRIRVKDQKSRWGSCSSKGNLNFNYRIFLLPDDLRDYVIVHEICHLKEQNHSKSFWDLVAKEIPDFKEKRKELKKYAIK